MAPKKAKTVRRDQKHGGKNGKKEGLSGSSFFTWFMVIALLGVWTSVAVVWFDLVDYEEFLGKLGDYDADGDGDFDVDDAKVLLGLKERIVSKKVSEDFDETDSLPSDISDADLEDIIKDSLPRDNDVFDLEDAIDDHDMQDDAASEFSLEDAIEPNLHESFRSEPDAFNLEDALDDHEPQDDAASEFSLEDAIEPNVHESLTSEPEVEEQVIEEAVIAEEEPTVEEQTIEDAEQEPAAYDVDDDDDVEHGQEPAENQNAEPVYEQEAEETETEFLNTPHTEESVDLEDVENEAEPFAEEIPAHVAEEEPDEEPEAHLETEEEEPQDEPYENSQETEVPESPEESETEDETVFYDEANEYNPELSEEEIAELLRTINKDTVEATEDVIDDNEEEVDEVPLDNEPSDPAAGKHIEVEQSEIPEHPVVDDRPREKAEEQDAETSEGQQGGHADT